MQIRNRWLYKKFSSIKTSILFLGLLSIFYLVGTIFPQGGDIEDYIKEGGRFVLLVKIFGLLDLFSTPLFFITAFLLFINLFICSYERFLALTSDTQVDTEFAPTHTIQLITKENIDTTFIKRLGFKKLHSYSNAAVITKGLSYKWLTWLYHIGIFLCFIGFFLTYLFAFEDEVAIYPNETKTILPSKQGRFQRLFNIKPKEFPFKIQLAEFITEYSQMPSIDYPKDKLSRLAIGLGWQGKPITYKIKEDTYFPKDWKSRLIVFKGDKLVLIKTIEVNEPLKYGGITFYQSAFKQDLKITIDNSPLAIDAEVDKEAILPGIENSIVFKNLRVGTLFKKDGTTEKIIPFVDVYMVKKTANDKKKKEKIGKLELGSSLTVEDKEVGIKEFKEATILSYRYDPGVPLLWFAGIMALVTMALRVYFAWYRIIYRVDEEQGAPLLKLSIKTRGLLADEEGMVRQVRHYAG